MVWRAIEVHRTLGPGLLESVYRDCMLVELRAEGLHVKRERRVSLEYRGQRIPSHLTVDLLVENCVVVELKALGSSLRSGLRRLVHPDLYPRTGPALARE